MRIIGTIVGAIIGLIITANVVNNICLLSFILFVFASIFFAVRNVNYALATLFLTPFVLILLDILIPDQTLLAQTRILDTLIGSMLTLFGVFIILCYSLSCSESQNLAGMPVLESKKKLFTGLSPQLKSKILAIEPTFASSE